MNQLKITEIFYSLQGEANTVGIPTVFIRLTGCPLRCHYCDTSYAFQGGNWWDLSEIIHKVATFNTRYITVTGGEPLVQSSCLTLLTLLCDAGYKTSLETSGALDISKVDIRVIKIMDIKTPESGEESRNLYQNIDYLLTHDQIKFVLCSREDYIWAKSILSNYDLDSRCEVLFSPSYNQLNPTHLAEWILEDKLQVRMQIQLHKYLWGDIPGR
ncbi:7-carboxy-7-deazaguanine synthase QueE [Candidatus Nitrosacidococcus tergens]|uniref:7-carboxy-7-deazaguanine synthase n=1 Tax=Candidatus Nitrosacidococcus tergens TaxID=553981 RepID=A0A7G1QBT3_9GAMM|nr:7-carboxy-7-deazaguanine synthase QueE [Candidatus Nitrosacidococcus tergens]CAB1277442.1 7-carboxy-7-deazaguanine synthase [Candidatus Nitrosacidococcus tergens]